MKALVNFLISGSLMLIASCQEVRTVKVHVTEKDGTPIQGADVSIWFTGHTSEQLVNNGSKTDANGLHVGHGTPLLWLEGQSKLFHPSDQVCQDQRDVIPLVSKVEKCFERRAGDLSRYDERLKCRAIRPQSSIGRHHDSGARYRFW